MLRYIFLCITLLSGILTNAQDISGRWQGNFGKNSTVAEPQKMIVLLELYNDSMIRGTTHLFYGQNQFEHYVIKGKYNKASKKIYFKEVREIEVKLSVGNVMGNYTMDLIETDSSLRFEGKWRENGTNYSLANSGVWLEKRMPRKDSLERLEVKEPKEKAITVEEEKPLAVTQPDVSVITEQEKLARDIEVQQAIAIKRSEADSIKIEIWDNARIDNDIISLFFNDKVVIDQQGITADHIVVYVAIPDNADESYLRLVAESYGSMPPCTAHMTISTRTKSREFELLSDYDLNAAVKLMVIE